MIKAYTSAGSFIISDKTHKFFSLFFLVIMGVLYFLGETWGRYQPFHWVLLLIAGLMVLATLRFFTQKG